MRHLHLPLAALLALGALLCPRSAATTEPPGPTAAAPSSQPEPACAATHPASAPAEPLEIRAYRLVHGGHPFAADIADAGLAWHLDPHVLSALMWEESRWKADVVNRRSGALGIAQFLPSGSREVKRLRARRGGRPWHHDHARNPRLALAAAAELLASHLAHCGDMVGALGRYGSGHCGWARGFALRVLQLANRMRVRAGLPPVYRERERNPLTPLPTS